MRRLLLLLVLLSPSGLAATLSSPQGEYEAQLGSFISIAVTGEGDSPLTVDAPPFLRLLGAPELKDGRALLNFLVEMSAPAGDHQVSISTPSGPPLDVTVRVQEAYGLEFWAPDDQTIVAGESVTYDLLVTNGGNTPATVLLEVSSRLSPTLSQEQLVLLPGESQGVELRLQSFAGSPQRDTATILVSTLEDESVRRFATIRTTVLPYGGAGAADELALRYRVFARATYGSAGLGYEVSARLAGQLSDFVDTDANLTFGARPEELPRLAGYASLIGERWRVTYRGARGTHRIDGRYDDFGAYAAIGSNTYGFGVSYEPSPLRIAFTHSGSAAGDRQTLTASYRFAAGSSVSVTPSIGAERRAAGANASYSAVFGVSSSLQSRTVVGSARARLPVPISDSWGVSGSVGSRSTSPFGVRVEASVNARGLHASAAATEELSKEFSLHQRLTYTYTGRYRTALNLGASYSSRAVPVSLGANVVGTLEARGFGVSYSARAGYNPKPFSLSAHISGAAEGLTGYGGTLGYAAGAWSATLGYAHSSGSDRLSAAVSTREGGFSGVARYGYNFTSLVHTGGLGLDYTFAQGHGLFSSLSISSDSQTSWQLGGRFLVQGGFATPEGVVNTFGGRSTSSVTGVAFLDVNANGVLDTGETPLPGLSVSSRGVTSVTDESGQYTLNLPPGTHTLTVSGLSASHGLLNAPAVTAEVGETHEVNVPIEGVTTLIVNVYHDTDRSGTWTSGERPLQSVAVELRGPGGTTVRRMTDSRGDAVFQNLRPGAYSFAVDSTSLPRFYETTSELEALTLAAGPTNRVQVGVAERPKDVVQTLSAGDLSLRVRVEPTQAPPGAEVLITAQAGGEPETVTAVIADGEGVALDLIEGAYQGRLSVPQTQSSVLMITVTAQRGDEQRTQQIPLLIGKGSLGRVSVSPTLADPAEELSAEITLLKRSDDVSLLLTGVSLPLEPTDDPYRYVATFPAPGEAGTYTLELIVDGEAWAEARFRVQ